MLANTLLENLIESILEKELDEMAKYPPEFNINDFKAIKSFSGRIEYAKLRLPALGRGTARAVFLADNDTVLKIALNAKGIVQNQTESDGFIQQSAKEFIAQVKDSDPEDTWIEMERAEKTTKTEFKRLTGFSLEMFGLWLRNEKNKHDTGQGIMFHIPPEEIKVIENSELAQDILDLVYNMDLLPADFGKISSWGMVTRGNGQKHLVLIDYGITKDTYQQLYQKKTIT